MSITVDTPPELDLDDEDRNVDPGGGGGDGESPGGGGGGRGDAENGDEEKQHVARLVVIAMWIGLAPILMLFLAFASAYVVRQGLGSEWLPVALPATVWANTLVLAASSLVLERGRRLLAAGDPAARGWLIGTLILGLAFVGLQLLAWDQLHARGADMKSAYSAFFYLLTGAHAVHLAGGVIGLAAAIFWPVHWFRDLDRVVAVKVAAIYWHFMGLIWVGLLLLLAFWR